MITEVTRVYNNVSSMLRSDLKQEHPTRSLVNTAISDYLTYVSLGQNLLIHSQNMFFKIHNLIVINGNYNGMGSFSQIISVTV